MTAVLESAELRQRADYTFKFNAKTGRHGWLRLTPAYSLKVVEEIIAAHDRPLRVFDPFCGTGTTVLSAVYHAHEGITADINPFLVWFSQAKVAHYSTMEVHATRAACDAAIGLLKQDAVDPVPLPAIHNIDRWWTAEVCDFLRGLRAAIEAVTAQQSAERTLLMVAFCRTLISLSNAAFNHQSMSFKADVQLVIPLDRDLTAAFADDVHFVLQGASQNPSGVGKVVLGDSRMPAKLVDDPVDLVVTSPPYANRMSYIRELRPYMYWLGFLVDGRDAGEMDWTAIGGTWGIATSRLAEWTRGTDHFGSDELNRALDSIAHSDNRNGNLLANYVAKYFDDMWAHFQQLPNVLARGAELHYIVGNSTFYGALVSTERLYVQMLRALGFEKVDCRPIRKRNSKKELVEFDVSARWGLQ